MKHFIYITALCGKIYKHIDSSIKAITLIFVATVVFLHQGMWT